MDCQYCGKIFSSDYNLRRHENEYGPNRDNDADEASNESMETQASHAPTNMRKVIAKAVLKRKLTLGVH